MFIPSFYSLRQCDEVTLANNTMPYVTSYYSCLNRIMGEGYSEDFQLTKGGITCKSRGIDYSTSEFKVINMFRFEGSVNANDNVLMYMLETTDGRKGTLIVPNTLENNRSLFSSDSN